MGGGFSGTRVVSAKAQQEWRSVELSQPARMAEAKQSKADKAKQARGARSLFRSRLKAQNKKRHREGSSDAIKGTPTRKSNPQKKTKLASEASIVAPQPGQPQQKREEKEEEEVEEVEAGDAT